MMPDVSKPVAKNMTPKGNQILEILRSHGDWMTRAEIFTKLAEKTGKQVGEGRKVLNKWDTALLELLISQGLVEVEKREFPGMIGFKWVYRATDEEGSA
jgi:hypothetical protein